MTLVSGARQWASPTYFANLTDAPPLVRPATLTVLDGEVIEASAGILTTAPWPLDPDPALALPFAREGVALGADARAQLAFPFEPRAPVDPADGPITIAYVAQVLLVTIGTGTEPLAIEGFEMADGYPIGDGFGGRLRSAIGRRFSEPTAGEEGHAVVTGAGNTIVLALALVHVYYWKGFT